MNEDKYESSFDDAVDIGAVLKTIWSRKILIGSITSFAALFTVLYALSLPNVYTSSTLLAPTSKDDSLSSKLGSLSGLAGLAGVSMGSGSISNSEIAVKRIQSFDFFSTYFLPNIELKNLVAIESWSPKGNTINYNESLYDNENNNWLDSKPSDQKAFKEYKKFLNIKQDDFSGLVKISIEHKSPLIAKEWVEIIIYNINESMREMDIKNAQNSINYLNESSKTVSIQSIKEVVSKLLESQMQTLMLASSNESYVFKIIESPLAPEVKTGPSRAILCILGTILGFILSLLVVLIQYYRSDTKE
jgi:hypothetical protein